MKLTMVGQDGHGEKHMVHWFRKVRLRPDPVGIPCADCW